MRLLIHDFAADSFSVELSREFARRGHDVRYVFFDESGSVRANVGVTAADPASFASVGIGLDDPKRRSSLVRRLKHDVLYSRHFVDEIREFVPDVVISANCPLFSQRAAQKATHAVGGEFVFWLQDVFGKAIESLFRPAGQAAAALLSQPFHGVEHRVLRESDHVLAIAPSFVDYLVEEVGVEQDRVTLQPNWAPLAEFSRDATMPSSWRDEVGIPAGALFLYSGTLGLKHNPDCLADLASGLAAEGASVAVISQGAGREHLEKVKADRDLSNLYLLDYQPFGRLAEVFQSADVLIAILNADASLFSIPSKVLPYLCVGRPILGLMPESNYSAEIVRMSGAGMVVPPEDSNAAITAARELAGDSGLRQQLGEQGQRFAAATFDVQAIADKVAMTLGIVDLTGSEHPDETQVLF